MTRRLADRVPWTMLAGGIPVLLTACVYWPLTRCWFWSDDFVHMASIVNDGFLRFVLRPFGGHNLLTRNLVFYASWRLFGLDAAPYFWLVFLTHLVNVWLLFRVVRGLTSSAALACFGAALWGTSPIAAGTLGWYSVFGQALVGTILLVVLERVVALARSDLPVSTRTAWTWYVLLLVGTTCFGVGLGVALAFPVALFLLVPAAWRQAQVRAAFLALPVVTILLYGAFRHLYPLLLEPLSSEELISEPAGVRQLPRVLALVWNQVAFALSEYPRSFARAGRAYPDRASTMVLVCVGVALGLLVWRGRPAARRAAVGLASLVLGVYLVIALGRVVLESPAFPLTRLATQARYHYVTGIPIVIVVCMAVQEIGRIGWLRRVPRVPLLVAVLALGAWAHTRFGFRIEQNLRARSIVEATLRGIASEVALRPPGAIVYLENGTNPVVLFGPMIPNALFPGRAAIFLLAHEDDGLDGRSVRFVERDPRILARYRSRSASRLARLLVPPDAADQHP